MHNILPFVLPYHLQVPEKSIGKGNLLCWNDTLRGTLEVWRWNQTYKINEAMIQILIFSKNRTNKLFSDENKIHRTLLEAEKVAGSATYKQSKTIWNFVVFSSSFVHSV